MIYIVRKSSPGKECELVLKSVCKEINVKGHDAIFLFVKTLGMHLGNLGERDQRHRPETEMRLPTAKF